MKIANITNRDALIIIDVQNDFLPGGSLAVPDGDAVLPFIAEIAPKFQNIVLTQDWHPAGHKSFASSHVGQAPFSSVQLPYGEQTLWPDHCVQGTKGAEFNLPDDVENRAHLILRKGCNPEIDSYSAFMENDKKTPTGLQGWLKERKIETVYLVGLATDYCVYYTATHAKHCGLNTVVLLDGCRGIAPETVAAAIDDMKMNAIKLF